MKIVSYYREMPSLCVLVCPPRFSRFSRSLSLPPSLFSPFPVSTPLLDASPMPPRARGRDHTRHPYTCKRIPRHKFTDFRSAFSGTVGRGRFSAHRYIRRYFRQFSELPPVSRRVIKSSMPRDKYRSPCVAAYGFIAFISLGRA